MTPLYRPKSPAPRRCKVTCGVLVRATTPNCRNAIFFRCTRACSAGPNSRNRDQASMSAAVLASLGPAERSVAEALLGGSAIVDDVARSARQPVATVLGALTVLELRGLVTAGGGRYRLAGVLAGAPPVQTAPVASLRQPVLP